jgi:hypothetical protein
MKARQSSDATVERIAKRDETRLQAEFFIQEVYRP